MQFQPGILSLINASAAQYGVDPAAMQRIAWLESRGRADAKNPRSSAGGLFQFIDSTAKQYGLSDRFDPAQAADAGARLARDNANILRRRLGRDPTAGELYLAHQQGAGGASKLLSNPNARAVDVVGADAVRLNGGNENMTAGEFANLWVNKAGGSEPLRMAVNGPADANGGTMQGLLGQLTGGKPQDDRTFGQRIKDSAKDGSLWDAMAIGFNTLRMNPDQNIAAMANQRMEGRATEAKVNQTAEWLRQSGREDLAQAIEGGMISGDQAFGMMQPQGPDVIEVNGQLVDKNTGQVVGDYRTPEGPEQQALMNAGGGQIYDPNTGEWIVAPGGGEQQLPEAVQALQWRAEQAGLKPGTQEYAQFMVDGGRSNGMAIDVDPATGAVSVRQGAGAGASGKPFTGEQSKDIGFATRARAALETFDPVAEKLTSRGQQALGAVPWGFGRDYQEGDYQVAENAGTQFLLSILRKDTGAAVTPSEEAMYGRVFLPAPGDSPEVLTQKKQARALAVAGLEAGMPPEAIFAQGQALISAGAAPEASPQPAAPAASQPTQRRRYNPQTGEFE